jgi:Zn-dependent protease
VAVGIIWYIVFLFSLTCHEAAHALVALWGGDSTAADGGQVTLNPIPHVRRAPFGTILVPIISFIWMNFMIGWASAPYNPVWADRYPRRAAWMALAGPTANLLLAILAGVLIRVFMATGTLMAPSGGLGFTSIVVGSDPSQVSGLGVALSILFSLNVLLFVFNLIPVPPLDGSSVITLLMPDDMGRRFRDFVYSGPLATFGILIAWFLIQMIFIPVFRIALSLLYAGA